MERLDSNPFTRGEDGARYWHPGVQLDILTTLVPRALYTGIFLEVAVKA